MHLQKGEKIRGWLARPEIQGYKLKYVVDEQGKAIEYGWCWINGVWEMVNDLFEIQGIPAIHREDIFDRFGPLNGHDTEGKPTLTWRNDNDEVMINGEPPTKGQGLSRGKIWVPAGWVSSIEATIKEGIVRTTIEGTPVPRVLVGEKPHVIWDVFGYKADDTRILISNPKHWDRIMFRELPKPATPVAT